MLRMKYGETAAVEFTESISKQLALAGWEAGLELAKEKGPAPIMTEEFDVTQEMLAKRPEMVSDGYKAGDKVLGRVLHARYSRYMQRIAEEAPELQLRYGQRWIWRRAKVPPSDGAATAHAHLATPA